MSCETINLSVWKLSHLLNSIFNEGTSNRFGIVGLIEVRSAHYYWLVEKSNICARFKPTRIPRAMGMIKLLLFLFGVLCTFTVVRNN